MHQVQFELTDQLYEQAKRRAAEAGFQTVEEYASDILTNELGEENTENYDHLFTPDRLAHLDSVIAKVRAGGKTHTTAEVREHFRKRFGE